MQIGYSRTFKKQYHKLPKRVREQFKKRLMLFWNDDRQSKLNFHKLTGAHEGLWSMNVTGDVRAIFDRSFDDYILFVAIGSHSELYS